MEMPAVHVAKSVLLPGAAELDALAVLVRLRMLVRASQNHSQRVERSSGVTGSQLWALRELGDEPGLRVGELARRMALHQSTASNMVDKLCGSGLVRRQRGTPDQRVVRVFLTEKGEAVLANAPSMPRGVLIEALHMLDARSLGSLHTELSTLLEKISEVDQDHSTRAPPLSDPARRRIG